MTSPALQTEAQQDDGCSCGSRALLSHEHDDNCTLVRCRRCGMDLPDHLPGDEHCRPCTRPHINRGGSDQRREQVIRWLMNNTANRRHDQWVSYEAEEAADELLALIDT